MKISYECIIEKQEDNKFLVTFPDFEEAFTEGESLEEAIFNAEEVLTLTLEGRIDEGLNIPLPRPKKHNLEASYEIYPSTRIQSALLVRFIRSQRSLSELARYLETSWPSASRLEDPHHWSSLRQLNRVAEAFGGRLVLSFESLKDSLDNDIARR
jgi:antitoxin HicB